MAGASFQLDGRLAGRVQTNAVAVRAIGSIQSVAPKISMETDSDNTPHERVSDTSQEGRARYFDTWV